MKFKFMYGGKVDLHAWGGIIRQLEDDLNELVAGKVSEEEIYAYIADLIKELRPGDNITRPDMQFLMFDRPTSMPSDARVNFVYIPTYIAATFMMTAVCRYKSVRENSEFIQKLRMLLYGATGRDFMGSGYDYIPGMFSTLRIFAIGDTVKFIETYPHINEEFTERFRGIIRFVQNQICTGKQRDAWSGEDYIDRGVAILKELGVEQ